MSEESDLEKTEAASPRRLEKAREEGQIARSRELGTFMMLAVGVAAIWAGGGSLYQGLTGVLRSGLAFDQRVALDPGVMVEQAVSGFGHALMVLLPIFGLLAVVAVLSSVVLGGLVISTKPLQPNFSKLSPLAGLKRMFSSQTVVELIKALAKAMLVGGVAVWVIWRYHDDMLGLMHVAPSAALTKALSLVAMCCAFIVASLLIIVLLDVPWQIWSHLKKLRMSKEDVRQEHKESEGDPHVKARIRQQQRQAARRRMMSEVPKADVVVTNPTHYAVALKYDESKGGAPRVLAKGTGLIAAKIRELAAENKIPTLEAPPLARALHQHVELGQEIPAELYTAVAEVLAWVFQLRSWRSGWGHEPMAPTKLNVPAELDPQAKTAAQGV
ncbi:flagellar biosynthesis protein FlhB [Achromobacter mucicolens]|jgi:flagellar biosynthetic protein FlhB|uniref:Flagellar biosynthetic protein FlhB n=1 Tax=Achromobacter mucicolens TaxID=1389922 RepID=A0ABD4Z0R6_9BURK|nr:MULTISPECIES: flagellar biosynthesis protein FlhB [Achromobacter]OXC91457.1 flagellar biosynthesis protein FlhB [Achromobacter sp. KAs 3-5]KRB17172.1 flagellar biosynthetic protein FlhB [Achromobacter sp. Root170]MCP2513908.1 flagellar biosynthesis protein FlhB [Achromobacter mucicolens]MCU6618907.1 flagellar biosynthesis protein FlhB [Achromobacter mucicolens]MDF2862768.1 Flagellar biosynthesis protein FlhB [Achromobacter mucicolens]